MKKFTKLASLTMATIMLISSVPFMSASAKTTKTAKKPISFSNVSKGIKLSWAKTNKAKKYTVYRSTKQNKGFSTIGTTKKLNFTDSKAKAGTTYYYKIKASTGANYQVAKAVRLKAPTLKTAVMGYDNFISLKWSAVKGATSYGVYRAKVVEGKPEKYNYIFTAGDTDFLDEVMLPGVYKYKICAENGYSESLASNIKTVTYEETLEKPMVIAYSNEEHTAIKVIYSRAADIEGYRIYRSMNSGGYFKLLADVKVGETEPADGILDDMGLSQYTDTDVTYGKTYLYAVETYYGKESSGKSEAYTEVEFDEADVNVKVGKSTGYLNRKLKSLKTLLGEDGYDDLLELLDVTYTVENPEIATIDEDNYIEGVSVGKTTVTATYSAKIEDITFSIQQKIIVSVVEPTDE